MGTTFASIASGLGVPLPASSWTKIPLTPL